MELFEDSASFVPDEHPLSVCAKPSAISRSRRHWRVPAIGTSMAVVAALCLYTGSTAQAAQRPKSPVVALQAAAKPLVTTGFGGVHGAFNAYDGPGGGVEFWFNPSTGSLTVAVGSGAGVGASGVIGTYAPGTEPAPGTYLYASATLSAGTVASENVSGTYSLNNGVFSGSVTATVDGRTVTLTSDGISSFNASVLAGSGAAGWSASTGIKFVFDFNISDVLNYIWDAIKDFFTGQYTLTDTDYDGYDTWVYSDDDSSGGDSASDDSGDSDDIGDSGDDASDDGDDGDDDGIGGDDGGGGCAFSAETVPVQGASVDLHTSAVSTMEKTCR